MVWEPSIDVVATLELAPLPESARNARRFIAEFCSATGLPEEVGQTASLLTSELVTNAIVHGRTSAKLHAHRPGDQLRVAVHDDNPALPEVGASPPLTDAEGGRGLAIVSMLAARWGVESDGAGKAVWFELDVP